MRMNNLNNETVAVMVEEETSLDSETNHLDEVVGFFAIEVPQVVKLELNSHCDTGSDSGSDINACDYIWDC